jgi:hypothetical protein
MSVAGTPPEADTPLIIDPDTVLARSIAFQRLEPVARRHAQKLKGRSGVDL